MARKPKEPETSNKLVVLCGSQRFATLMDELAIKRTLEGAVVWAFNVDIRQSLSLFKTKKKCDSCHGKTGLITICTKCNHTGLVEGVNTELQAEVKTATEAVSMHLMTIADVVVFVSKDAGAGTQAYYGDTVTAQLKNAAKIGATLEFTNEKHPQWVADILTENGYEVTDGVYKIHRKSTTA